MRIDLEHGRRRPWTLRLLLRVVQGLVGMVHGPLLMMTYRTDFMSAQLRHYVQRGMRGSQAWSKGESELMAAFVSNLNRCHF